MTEILEKMAKNKPVVPVTRNIPESSLRTVSDGTHDPHVWFDVKLWMSAAETIRDTLIENDSAHEAEYRSRAEAYLAKLDELDRYAREQIATIPEQGRVMVTAHDAFGYFGDAYAIEVVGLQGISTAAEYGSKDVTALRDMLVERQVKAVFVESSVPKKSIEAVIEGAKKLGHDVKIGGELFSDAMGKNGTEEGTYIGMVRHNVDTIVGALK
jgi:manganese/zinc/iron transport system substrate-binding protein